MSGDFVIVLSDIVSSSLFNYLLQMPVKGRYNCAALTRENFVTLRYVICELMLQKHLRFRYMGENTIVFLLTLRLDSKQSTK